MFVGRTNDRRAFRLRTKSTDTTSTKQAKEAQATPTSTPFQYYASVDDEPRTISGKCGDNAEWSYNTGTKVLTISGSGAVDRAVDSDTSKQRSRDLQNHMKSRKE